MAPLGAPLLLSNSNWSSTACCPTGKLQRQRFGEKGKDSFNSKATQFWKNVRLLPHSPFPLKQRKMTPPPSARPEQSEAACSLFSYLKIQSFAKCRWLQQDHPEGLAGSWLQSSIRHLSAICVCMARTATPLHCFPRQERTGPAADIYSRSGEGPIYGAQRLRLLAPPGLRSTPAPVFLYYRRGRGVHGPGPSVLHKATAPREPSPRDTCCQLQPCMWNFA